MQVEKRKDNFKQIGLALLIIIFSIFVWKAYCARIPSDYDFDQVKADMTTREVEIIVGCPALVGTNKRSIEKRISEAIDYWRTSGYTDAQEMVGSYQKLSKLLMEGDKKISIRIYRYSIRDFVLPAPSGEMAKMRTTYDHYQEIIFVDGRVYLLDWRYGTFP
ncbi:hypothetical protein JZO70_20545 [Enterococcus sp. 669A]|uniref:Uncharacterized protein n=1 Tax=Candidatus Enterococcus moelleringii TaxID=2815325 RepID=A0ABS3LG18_9ENTE|nr:hypothetical protein [Enterococcus sp. 669A]MBO1308576.1 hypothetical protein [Enterococcus sp. 669A]